MKIQNTKDLYIYKNTCRKANTRRIFWCDTFPQICILYPAGLIPIANQKWMESQAQSCGMYSHAVVSRLRIAKQLCVNFSSG
jgi:hypothetical protein